MKRFQIFICSGSVALMLGTGVTLADPIGTPLDAQHPGTSLPPAQLNQNSSTKDTPIDDYSLNTKPALGSSPPQGGIGAGYNIYNNNNTLNNRSTTINPQSGLNQQLGATFGRTLNDPQTLGPNARGAFFPTTPQASNALRPNSGYGIPTGGRPSHMDARGIQRIN